VTRNQLLSGDVALYVGRSDGHTDILHEYFLPDENLAAFLEIARNAIPRHQAELLNMTLRDVRRDDDTFLAYATRDFIATVMFFHQPRTAEAEAQMRDLSRELIDASLRLGGRYYLPYRPHATREQFRRAYPRAPQFFELKQRYDPQGLFRSQFYQRYFLEKDAV
jgi:FAD/FMN-containing dehydrogenase